MTNLETQVKEWMATLSLNHRVIEMQLKGLTHDDTLIKLPFRGNRMNWTLGHLAEHRDWMLRAVDCTTLMPANQVMIYRSGSDELTDDVNAVQMDTLMNYLGQARDSLLNTLESATDDFLNEIPNTGILLDSHRNRSRFQRLKGLLWHETYHIGQLELLRQLTGVNDSVIG